MNSVGPRTGSRPSRVATQIAPTFVPPPVHEMQKAARRPGEVPPRYDLAARPHSLRPAARPVRDHPPIHRRQQPCGAIADRLLALRAGDPPSAPAALLELLSEGPPTEYYDRLMAVRLNGDWEGWVKFSLQGVFEVSLIGHGDRTEDPGDARGPSPDRGEPPPPGPPVRAADYFGGHGSELLRV